MGKNLVMTAAHVVRGVRSVSVRTEDGEITSARIIEYDLREDTALLRTEKSLSSKSMVLYGDDIQQGSELAALGYPLAAYDLRISRGIVSGLNDSADYGDQKVDNVFTTDAATNGGNSGGPVVNRDGEVIGLVSGGQEWSDASENRRPVEGVNFMVPANELRTRLAKWKARDSREQSECEDEAEPSTDESTLQVSIDSDNPDAKDIAQVLYSHGQAINEGSYESAWTLFTPKMQKQMGGLNAWESGLLTSYWVDLTVRSVERNGNKVAAGVNLTTKQEEEYGKNGQTCSKFDITYTMVLTNGVWLIDHAQTAPNSPTAC